MMAHGHHRVMCAQVDFKRNFVFCLFGAAYLGMFQYWYQVRATLARTACRCARPCLWQAAL